MAKRESTKKQYIEIKKDFERMNNIREKNAKKFTTEYILNSLAEKYYKSPKTIENIVFSRI